MRDFSLHATLITPHKGIFMDAETTRLLMVVGGFLIAFMIFRKLIKLALFVAIGLALLKMLG